MARRNKPGRQIETLTHEDAARNRDMDLQLV